MTVTSDPRIAARSESPELDELHFERADPGRGDGRRKDFDCRGQYPSLERPSRVAGVRRRRPRRVLEPRPGQRLAFREEVRFAHGYAVDAPGGEVGRVVEVRVAPYEFWPEALLVCPDEGAPVLVPVTAIVRSLPRERRLVLREAPPGARVVPRPPEPWRDRERLWQLVGAAGFVGGVGGYVAVFVALALGVSLAASAIIAGAGVIGAAASGLAWNAGRRSWLVAAGLGSAWLPLAVGVILLLVRLFG